MNSNRFKVGDKVTCIDNHFNFAIYRRTLLTLRKEYEVISTYFDKTLGENVIGIKADNGDDDFFKANRFISVAEVKFNKELGKILK